MNNTKNNTFSLQKFLAKKDQEGFTYFQNIGIAFSYGFLVFALFQFALYLIESILTLLL